MAGDGQPEIEGGQIMITRRQVTGLIVGASIAVMGGIGNGAAAQEKTVGISLPEAQNPFYVLLGKSIKRTLEKRGMKTLLLSADADVNEQISNINDLIAAKVDLIIMSPMNLEGPAPAVKAANDAGIPVIMIARRLADKYKHLWKAFVGFDLAKVGAVKGQWLVDNLKPGKVAVVERHLRQLYVRPIDQKKHPIEERIVRPEDRFQRRPKVRDRCVLRDREHPVSRDEVGKRE